ncbi:MAG TPA: NADH-quinone oxidoreductase subunit M [Candidatus Nanoarchaeia archaeon]|nr:NADH-quinone oxidoreductase subunit M [Candidatus Nanoarchaeia archaeon]
MNFPILLTVLLVPLVAVPFVYLAGRKSAKYAAILLALVAAADLGLILTTVSSILNNSGNVYSESYPWISVLNSQFTLSVDGIGISMAIVTMVLMLTAALYSINYMEGKKNLPIYYALLSLLFVGLVGVFITSNLLFFYFCWELMLVPAYFIIGGWGYKDSYKTSFKFFVFTHAGAVFVLLGIGAMFMLTGSLNFTAVQQAFLTNPALADTAKFVLIAVTAGFMVKMAIVPVHMWLPDAYAEAPAPMSALLGGVLTSAGAYAVIRVSIGIIFPAVAGTTFGNNFLEGLAIFGVISAFFGSFIALAETDLKRVIAYSSISHMGYILFGASLIPVGLTAAGAGSVIQNALTGTVLHIVTHALSKGLFFLAAGGVMQVLALRNIKEMGGLAGKMPVTGTSSTIAALSLAGAPPFACFISEFLIFMGAFQVIQGNSALAGFFIIPTALMLVATVFSLGYSLRFTSLVFLGQSKNPTVEGAKKKLEVPRFMQLAMVILVVLVVIVGVYPAFFVNLINTASHLAAMIPV